MKYIFSLILTISPLAAFAQDEQASGGISSLVIQLLIIFAIFYFLIIRPQNKKFKAHKEMTTTLSKGDKVVVNGIAGIVSSANDDAFIDVEISGGVKVKVLRSSITEKLKDDVKIKFDSAVEEKSPKKKVANKKEKAKPTTKAAAKSTKGASKTKSATKTKTKTKASAKK